MQWFSVKLGWFPTTGLDSWQGYVLPSITLGVGVAAIIARFTRSALIDVLKEDYIRTGRAKGFSESKIMIRQALKNAMVPILPMIISSFIGILGGSMIIEQIFSIPGIGRLYIDSINQLDYDVFMLDSIFYTLIGLLAGIVVDISYGFIDPRIKMGQK